MSNQIMVGQKFGRLFVVSAAKSQHKRTYWNCLCECGNTCIAMGKYLRQGKKRSCGCLKRESAQINARAMTASNSLPSGVAAFNLLYASYRASAESRSIEFNLTKDELQKLTKESCFYCGVEPLVTYLPRLPNGGYVYNGVDRKDNNLGYELTNCVSCCKTCNWMKNTHSAEKFILHCFAVVNHQKGQSNGRRQ